MSAKSKTAPCKMAGRPGTASQKQSHPTSFLSKNQDDWLFLAIIAVGVSSAVYFFTRLVILLHEGVKL